MPPGRGSRRAKRRCWIARGRTSFASTDGQPRGRRCSGRAGRPKGRKRGGRRDRSRTQVPRLTRGPAGSRHCERRRGTARGRDSCTWPRAGTGPALRAGGPAGAGTEEVGGGTARGLAASLGLRAGWEPVPQGGEGKGWPVVGARPFPRGTPGGLAGRGQPGAIARQRLASGGPGGQAAGERAGGLVRTAGRRRARREEGELGLIDRI